MTGKKRNLRSEKFTKNVMDIDDKVWNIDYNEATIQKILYEEDIG